MFVVAVVVLLSAAFAGICLASASQPGTDAYEKQPDPPQKLSLTKSAILGVVEGLTEYLPVSSTGHLILAGRFMGLVQYSDQTGPFGKLLDKDKMEAINSFDIVIQLGAILAVLGLYRKRVGQMCAGLVGQNPQGLKLFALLIVAFLPAAIVGVPLHKTIEAFLFGPIPVAYALAVGGVLMIAVEYFYRRSKSTVRTTDLDMITFRQALIIGIAQILAMWPGTSRSMITIIAALLVGLDMLAAAEFSFLLALPTLMGATVISAHEDWSVLKQVAGIDGMLVGMVVSGIVAALAIKGFVKWLTHHGLTPFGIYRLIVAALVFLFLAH
ncbi:MAG: undecaprenyl-diphosphate phosphatase [Planctomycetota bacterium]|nr:undecaprenyl-diphosphate phosphatase [Planctomycetota bacterium]